jgi:hypothetical protein
MVMLRVGRQYKTRGYAERDLFGYVPGERTVTILANAEGWCDDLPFVAIDERGNRLFTCDGEGRVYPPQYRGNMQYLGSESPFDLMEVVE